MSYEERGVWAYLCSSAACYIAYLVIVVPRLFHAPVAQASYIGPLLVTTLASVVLATVIRSGLEIARPSDSSKADARDREIARFGEYASRWFVICGSMAAFIMATRRLDYFWIANVIYLGFVLWAVAGSVLRVIAYRRGL